MVADLSKYQQHGNGDNLWYTPPYVIADLGPFDLDPCFSEPRPWDTAAVHYGKDDPPGGGLYAPWHGLVWCNPPYDQSILYWLWRCAMHGNCIALVFARTDTEAFHKEVFPKASALFFLKGRLQFLRPDGTTSSDGGAPSLLIAYGGLATSRLRKTKLPGYFVNLSAQNS